MNIKNISILGFALIIKFNNTILNQKLQTKPIKEPTKERINNKQNNLFQDKIILKNWFKIEIDKVLDVYKKTNNNKKRLNIIDETIEVALDYDNISSGVIGDSWEASNNDNKLNYLRLFRTHLGFYILDLMEPYSGQAYKLANVTFNRSTKIYSIKMKIILTNNSIVGFFTNNLISTTFEFKKYKNEFKMVDFLPKILLNSLSKVDSKKNEFYSILKENNYNLKVLNDYLLEKNDSAFRKYKL
uniref:Uncharacterized protein n=1 Tax=viral metagenome TaxID=1070528 RepID=A0A6C0EIQ5_9ZZZZ